MNLKNQVTFSENRYQLIIRKGGHGVKKFLILSALVIGVAFASSALADNSDTTAAERGSIPHSIKLDF